MALSIDQLMRQQAERMKRDSTAAEKMAGQQSAGRGDAYLAQTNPAGKGIDIDTWYTGETPCQMLAAVARFLSKRKHRQILVAIRDKFSGKLSPSMYQNLYGTKKPGNRETDDDWDDEFWDEKFTTIVGMIDGPNPEYLTGPLVEHIAELNGVGYRRLAAEIIKELVGDPFNNFRIEGDKELIHLATMIDRRVDGPDPESLYQLLAERLERLEAPTTMVLHARRIEACWCCMGTGKERGNVHGECLICRGYRGKPILNWHLPGCWLIDFILGRW